MSTMTTLAPRGWRQWTPDEARAALAQWEKSGLSAVRFAQLLGVSGNRLRWWKQRLARPAPTTSTPAKFVPAVVTSVSTTPVAIVQVRGGSIEVFDAGAAPASWVAAVARELSGE